MSERLTYLFERYISESIHPEELRELSAMALSKEHEDKMNELFRTQWEKQVPDRQLDPSRWDVLLQRILYRPAKVKRLKTLLAAASLIGLLAVSVAWFFLVRKADNAVSTGEEIVSSTDIAPARQGVTLTRGDGSVLMLDSLSNGALAIADGATAIKQDGSLRYAQTKAGIVQYNTITTKKGSVFHLQLPDGTEVWLDALSSIRFPTVFNGNEREVEITGQAYFEVKPRPLSGSASGKKGAQPFRVRGGGQVVEVLGTHFNVNTYDGKSIKTTLLEGSVRVSTESGASEIVIKPGQQCRMESMICRIESAPNLEEVMAWKNGITAFRDANIQDIMRQIARWYDVEVEYEGDIPQRIFTGEVSREARISEVFRILELSEIHFRLEGRKVVVTK